MNKDETIDVLQERLDAYRKRSIKLAGELDTERREKERLQVVVAQLKAQQQVNVTPGASQAVDIAPGSAACSACSQQVHQSHCVHKSALASHIIDLTFDSHKDVLRTKLRAATEELERLRARPHHGADQSISREVQELRSANETQQRELDALRRELCDAKINAMKSRFATTCADTTASNNQQMQQQHLEDRRRMLEERAGQSLLLQLAFRTLHQFEQLGSVREEYMIEQSELAVSSVASLVAEGSHGGDVLPHSDPVERHLAPLILADPNVHREAHLRPPQQRRIVPSDENGKDDSLTPRRDSSESNPRKRATQPPRPLRGLL